MPNCRLFFLPREHHYATRLPPQPQPQQGRIRSMKCLAISWNHEDRVAGVVIEKARPASKPTVIATCASPSGQDFPGRLTDTFNKLNAKDIDLVILGGYIGNAVCFELPMPRLSPNELRNALAFELSRQLPCGTEELTVFHRRINDDKQASSACVRVFAVKSRTWEELLSKIAMTEIKADLVCHPFMAIDPILHGKNIFLPEIEEKLILEAAESPGGQRQIKWISATEEKPQIDIQDITGFADGVSDQEELNVACLLGAYGLSCSSGDRKTLSPLPDHLKPQRCKVLKGLAAGLTLFAGILLLGIGYRHWNDAYFRTQAINAETARIDRMLALQQKKIKAAENLGKTAGKLLEATDEPDLLRLMNDLTRLLPESMWITNLRASNRKIVLTIQAENDREDISAQLSRLNGYVVENLRKMRNPNNTVVMYVSLAMKNG